MGYYVRMINHSKWSKAYKKLKELEESKEVTKDDTHADVITTELRTQKNTISLWKIENLNELDEIILSLALNREKLDRLDIMIIEQEKLENYIDKSDIHHDPKTAYTAINKLEEKHYDIVNMNYDSIGKLSECMMNVWQQALSNNELELVRKISPNKIRKIYTDSDLEKINEKKIKNKLYVDLKDVLKKIEPKLSKLEIFVSEPLKLQELNKIIQDSASLDIFVDRMNRGVYSFGNTEVDKIITDSVREYVI